jgi:UDP-N-acetylmuramoyl-tripeptide--D-alanyl-D-alanine ligase
LITFGLHSSLDYWASDIKFGQGGMNAILHHGKFSYPLFIPVYGEHNIVNALASIAAVHTLGMELKKASQLMSSFRHIESHLEISKGINGSTVIDDSWSSNPTSIKAALSVLDEISHNKKSVFVIGRISLLGEAAKEQYGQVAKLIVEHKVDTLITIGSETQEVADKVLELGMDKSAVHHCNDASSALQKMMETASEDTIILIKSSMYDSNTDLINKIRLQE